MPSALVTSLIAERDALVSLLRTWTEEFVTAGAPGDFQVSVEGESYDFSGWRMAKLNEIEKLNQLIRQHSPFIVRSRMRG